MQRVLLLTLLMAVGIAAADVTGKWRGTLTPQDRDAGPALLVLKQDGENITGTGGPDESERHDIRNGKLSGDKLQFEIPQGEAMMKFDLTLSGDEITGDVSRERNGQQQRAKLSLKREKQ